MINAKELEEYISKNENHLSNYRWFQLSIYHEKLSKGISLNDRDMELLEKIIKRVEKNKSKLLDNKIYGV